MADDVFRLPGSGYETVARVIKAYAQVREPTPISTIAGILGTDTTNVSRNHGFLLSVGLVDGGNVKGPTAQGIKLGRALEFDEADDIAQAWREVLAPHPLIQRILAAIRVRGGMDPTTLQSQIVYTAGLKKNSGAMTGGGAVIEMMRAAKLIADRDGKYIATNAAETTARDEDDHVESAAVPTAVVQRVIEAQQADGVVVHVNLEVQINASVDDLPALGENLRRMLNSIRREALSNTGDGSPD